MHVIYIFVFVYLYLCYMYVFTCMCVREIMDKTSSDNLQVLKPIFVYNNYLYNTKSYH